MPRYPRGIIGPSGRSCPDLPPGQHETTEFPIASTLPPPQVRTAQWTFTLTTESGPERLWGWAAFRALPAEKFSVDLHSVHGWSKLATNWEGVPFRTLLDGVRTTAEFAHVSTYTDYTTTVPLEDLQKMPTWIAYKYEGKPISMEHGGPARLLIPHLYLFKSAKWIRGITLSEHDETRHPRTRRAPSLRRSLARAAPPRQLITAGPRPTRKGKSCPAGETPGDLGSGPCSPSRFSR